MSNHSLIHPIRIPTPFAVGNVYSYLLTDEKVVLIDCGHKSDISYKLIKNRLSEQNYAIEDLDEIWLTHGHPDHFGLASRLADESGALVKGHGKERANFSGNNDGDLFERFFRNYKIPGPLIEMMTGQLEWLQQFQIPVTPEWIEEGEAVESGELEFEVKHTPGHAPGHVVFYSRDEGIIFGGDVLLEHISTNALVNFDPDTRERNKSLLQYRQSLKWMLNCKGTVYPGHGQFIDDISKVVNNHLKDQEDRYKRILKMLEGSTYTLFELAKLAFPEAMNNEQGFLVLSEVMGYLDWGIDEGLVRDNEGVFGLTG